MKAFHGNRIEVTYRQDNNDLASTKRITVDNQDRHWCWLLRPLTT